MRKVKSAYNKIFRSLMNIKDVLETTKCMLLTNVNPCDVVRRKLMYSFRKRLYASDNYIITTAVSSVYFYTSTIAKQWNTAVFKF